MCYVNSIHDKMYRDKEENTRVRKHNLGVRKKNEWMVQVVDVY